MTAMQELIEELAATFQEYLRVDEDLRDQTLQGYQKRLDQFARWAGTYSGDPLTPEGFRAYFDQLKTRRLSPYTRKGHYHILKRFADWLTATGWLPRHPMATIRPPKIPKVYQPKAIKEQEFERMLDMCAAENYYGPPFPGEFFAARDRALLLFMRDTGCRSKEVLLLRWGTVDLEGGRATTLGKRDRLRRLYFKQTTAETLIEYRKLVPHEPRDAVWWSHRGRQLHPLTTCGLRHVFDRLARWASVEGPHSPHSLRHAFGRDTHKNGAATAIVQDLMGHTSIEVTKIYSQFDDEELKQAHDRYSPLNNGIEQRVAQRKQGGRQLPLPWQP